ncbi:MAG: hypothetical protein WAW17_20590 [Rhodococcus sp. (in: high G+C Gram-positive bacteria)]|uniref:hypothetical protein n=1 Tax=Rhodococcus sp. TaxID=1831 RepID=UPI003BAE39B6
MTSIPSLFVGLCDDAALFPPGNAPLPDALPAHAVHLASGYADLVGPLVFPVSRLGELAEHKVHDLELSLTAPGGPEAVTAALDTIAAIDGASLVALEIAPRAEQSALDFFTALEALPAAVADLDIFVEVPRGERRPDFLEALRGSPFAAKFRTGGVVAEAYPDERELAEALHTVVSDGTHFKATAGLHHAVRNTDPVTGFEQHGFLNLMLATRHALGGAGSTQVAAALAERDGGVLARELTDLSAEVVDAVRRSFRSFGTCSVLEPLEDLMALGLVPSSVLTSASEGAHA